MLSDLIKNFGMAGFFCFTLNIHVELNQLIILVSSFSRPAKIIRLEIAGYFKVALLPLTRIKKPFRE